METTLKDRVAAVQQASRRLVRLHGLARWLIVAVASFALFGLLDYLIRPAGSAARWALSLAVTGCWVWALGKWVLPPLWRRDDPVAVAQRIERHFRTLERQLSSAIAFLDDESAGPSTTTSSALRHAAIAHTEAIARRLDFHAALDGTPVWRMLRGAILAMVALVVLAVSAPATTRLAVQRLAMPWRELAWPRRHELVLVDPVDRIAAGDAWQLEVVDRHGDLPGDVQLLVRAPDSGGGPVETHDMRRLDDRAIYRIDNLFQGFEYRVRGGDDDTMPWTELSVSDPPQLLDLTVEVTPPGYTGLPPTREGRVVKAILGSRLQIRGRFDKPIREVGITSTTRDFQTPQALVTAGGHEFAAPPPGDAWLVERSGMLTFNFTDAAGVRFGRDVRIELQAVEDAPPAITWQTPADRAEVVAQAIVPVRGTVKDDLAVREIQLRIQQVGQANEDKIITLYLAEASTAANEDGRLRAFDFAWDLSQIPTAKPGEVFSLAIEAIDSHAQKVGAEQRRVSIISNDELVSRLNSRLAAVIERLADTLQIQRQILDDTQKLRSQWPQSPAGKAALPNLSALQNRQRQVEEAIGGGMGTTVELRAMQEEMIINRTQEQRLALKLAEMLGQLVGLSERALPAIDLQFAQALQLARQELDLASAKSTTDQTGQSPTAVLAAASHEQLTVVRVLESVVGELSELDSLSRIAAQLRQIAQEQADVVNETSEQQHASLAGELSADVQAKAKQLAEVQSRLALNIDKLQLRLAALADGSPRSENQELLPAAARAAQRLAIGSQMRFAAEQLLRREWGQALATEMAAAEAIGQLQQALDPTGAADRLQPDWPAALGSGIAALADRQQQVLSAMEEMHTAGKARRPASVDPRLDAASTEERALAADTRQLREKARAAPALDFALGEAADAMQSASERLMRSELARALRDASVAYDRLSLLLKALEPTSESPIQESVNSAEPQPNSQSAGPGAELRALKAMQEELNQRTHAAASGKAQPSETAALARQQGKLADLMQDLLERLSEPTQAEPNRP